jgi:hypothetical protein
LKKPLQRQSKKIINDIDKYIRHQNMKEIDTGNFSMGLYKIYKNKDLSLRYINERGFGIIEIGPAKEDNDFFCVDFFKELYESKKTRTPLSIKEQLSFIRQNYNEIIVDLNSNNHEVTFNKINKMLNKS